MMIRFTLSFSYNYKAELHYHNMMEAVILQVGHNYCSLFNEVESADSAVR